MKKLKLLLDQGKNNIKLACVGDTYSFNKSLRASANA